MEDLNTDTKLSRKKAFWFSIVTPAILVLASIFTDINYNIVSSYCLFCTSVIGMILGTKANDVYQVRKKMIDKEEVTNKYRK